LSEGTIKRVRRSNRLIEKNLAKAYRDIKVSQKLLKLGEFDWAYTSAYTAMLVAARGYMNSKGYRPSSSSGHVAVVRFLEIEDAESPLRRFVNIFDRMRRNRHRVMYDEYDLITLNVVRQAYDWALEFVELIAELIE
jgi:uncharacterized protein (UPF0332 family)